MTTLSRLEGQRSMNSHIHQSEGKNDNTTPPKPSHLQAKSESATFGKVELKYISVGDLTFVAELLDKVKDDREFVVRALHHQLMTPEVSFAEFNKTPDDELVRLARDFAGHERDAFRYLEETTDVEFFANFRQAMKTRWQRHVEQIGATLEGALQNLSRLAMKPLQRIGRILSEVLPPFLEQVRIAEQEGIPLLIKYKWLTSPSLPLYLVFEAVRIGGGTGSQRKAMNRLFVDYFSSNDFANLAILVEGWRANTLFKPRMKIFRDCISVLRSAKSGCNPSNVVLPTLIAQIEGIRTEFMKQQGLSFDLESWKWEDSKGNVHQWEQWLKGQTSNHRLLDPAIHLVLNILFQKSRPGEPLETPFTFSRHKIMHGEQFRYGSIANTIRAFLILDLWAGLSSDWLSP